MQRNELLFGDRLGKRFVHGSVTGLEPSQRRKKRAGSGGPVRRKRSPKREPRRSLASRNSSGPKDRSRRLVEDDGSRVRSSRDRNDRGRSPGSTPSVPAPYSTALLMPSPSPFGADRKSLSGPPGRWPGALSWERRTALFNNAGSGDGSQSSGRTSPAGGGGNPREGGSSGRTSALPGA